MRELDLEVTSEFLLIAATLIQLKARFLLPDDEDLDLDEELALMEERDRLLSRLLACATFKDVAAVFGHRFAGQARYVPRRAGLDILVSPAPRSVTIGSPGAFGRLAAQVFERARYEVDLDHLDLDLPSVPMALADLRERVQLEVTSTFEELTAHCNRSMEVAAYFLAMLELARWGMIELSQSHRDAPITMRARPEGVPAELVSEWE
jgi:segregation and condensation protein A